MGILGNVFSQFTGGGGINALMRALNLGGTFLSSREQQRQTDAATERTEDQIARGEAWSERGLGESLAIYDQGMGQAQGIFEGLPGQYNANRNAFNNQFNTGAGSILGGYGDRYGFAQGQAQDILGGYDDRYRFAQQQIEGYGQQQEEDIDRRFDEEQARSRMALGSRGLLSSTEASTQGLGVAERRSAEQRRLQEGLMSSRVNLLSGLSGDRLNAQGGLLDMLSGLSGQGLGAQQGLFEVQSAYDAAMRGDTLGSQQNLANFYAMQGQGRTDLYNQGVNRNINTIFASNYIPPPPNPWPNQFGQNFAQPPSSPDASGEQIAAWGVNAGRAAAGFLG